MPTGIEVRGAIGERFDEILTEEALAFVAELSRTFEPARLAILAARAERQAALAGGGTLGFLEETAEIRAGDWQVAPVPEDLQVRKVEITGPTDRKMVINALNCGASVYMADFEDATTPTWDNLVSGQVNLADAVRRTIELTTPEGKSYRLAEKTATLVVRPRGWHLPEKHLLIDGTPVAGAFMDFGLYAFHNAARLVARGSGPYFYLPKLEGHREARLWNEIFVHAQQRLGLEHGTIKATVLVETFPAAFEMDEILYELRDHSAGLNAGRWDYIFSVIKKFNHRPDFLLPDRAQVTMTVPFMRSYTELLVRTCHRRGAFAIGGMAAFIPTRKDPKVNEVALARVREDKIREATAGFDGTWVAHPDLVPTAMAELDRVLGDQKNQLDRTRNEVRVTAEELQRVTVPGGTLTDAGVRNNVSVAIQYLESWLRGTGAAAIYNLMEDAATAEISRSQVWQWVRHGARTVEGTAVTADAIRTIGREEVASLDGPGRRFADAQALFEQVALSETFVEFLTLPGYDLLP
ncbi:MAG TPA: malate synthase A [Candidatus Saccharimonadales bacterium]|nr:malate synthase A [Candidatus Saccharimonadales bacterium]